jgi:hypothetical protein
MTSILDLSPHPILLVGVLTDGRVNLSLRFTLHPLTPLHSLSRDEPLENIANVNRKKTHEAIPSKNHSPSSIGLFAANRLTHHILKALILYIEAKGKIEIE